MGILEFIAICVALGLIVWGVNTYLPIPQPMKTHIMVAAILVIVVIFLNAIGLMGVANQPIPRLR